MEKELKVKKIKDGIVLDHLPCGKVLDIIKILNIDKKTGETVSILMNVESASKGKKDIIKIENKKLEDLNIDKIAIIAPNATVNVIKDFQVVKKRKIRIPDIIDIINCPNPSCITNQKEPVKPKLLVEQTEPLKARCYYCERVFTKEELVENI